MQEGLDGTRRHGICFYFRVRVGQRCGHHTWSWHATQTEIMYNGIAPHRLLPRTSSKYDMCSDGTVRVSFT